MTTPDKSAREIQLERMLELKQDDWIEACGDIDKLKDKAKQDAAEIERLRELSGTTADALEGYIEALERHPMTKIYHGRDLVKKLRAAKEAN